MAIDSGTNVKIAWAAYDVRTIGITTNQRIQIANQEWTTSFTAGAGAAQFSKPYIATRTMAATSENVDLSGVLTDIFGATITAVRVKAWGIKNTSSTSLTITTSGANGWQSCMNGVVVLPPGAFFAFSTPDATGWTVTAGTADLIAVSGTNPSTYEIHIWAAET